jgi:hypothetical protein
MMRNYILGRGSVKRPDLPIELSEPVAALLHRLVSNAVAASGALYGTGS